MALMWPKATIWPSNLNKHAMHLSSQILVLKVQSCRRRVKHRSAGIYAARQLGGFCLMYKSPLGCGRLGKPRRGRRDDSVACAAVEMVGAVKCGYVNEAPMKKSTLLCKQFFNIIIRCTALTILILQNWK